MSQTPSSTVQARDDDDDDDFKDDYYDDDDCDEVKEQRELKKEKEKKKDSSASVRAGDGGHRNKERNDDRRKVSMETIGRKKKISSEEAKELLSKFANQTSSMTISKTEDEEDEFERAEEYDFEKVPDILKEFERTQKKFNSNNGGQDDSYDDFSDDDDDDKNDNNNNNNNPARPDSVLDDDDDDDGYITKEKTKTKTKTKTKSDLDDYDNSFEEKLLTNADDGKKLRMRADIAIDDMEEYRGKSTTREKMFSNDDDYDDHYDDDEEEEEFDDIQEMKVAKKENDDDEDDDEFAEYDSEDDEKKSDGEEDEDKDYDDDWDDDEMRAVLDTATKKKGKRRRSDKEAAKLFKKFESELPRLDISDSDEEEDDEDEEEEDEDEMDVEEKDKDGDDSDDDGAGTMDDDFVQEEEDDDFDYASAMEKNNKNTNNSNKQKSTKKRSNKDHREEEEDEDEFDEEEEDPELEKELKKFEMEELETKRLAENKQKTEQKSKSVRIQRALWEHMLRMRIKLQKGIENGMKMPGPIANKGLRRNNSNVNEHLVELASVAKGTLTTLLNLQLYLMKQFEKTGALDMAECADKVKNLKQRENVEKGEYASTDQFWDVCETMQKEFEEFRDSSCDRWQRKSQVSSGNAANLKAFNQNISQQVRAAMLAPEKAIDRSRPALMRTKKLGENIHVSRLDSDESDDERFDDHNEDDEDNDDGLIKNSSSGGGKNNNRRAMKILETRKDVESYDDFDMYEQLLKEFLESGNVDGDAPRNAAKPAKRRKIVDRRASKGRKIRYHVQEPLVNFVPSIDEDVPQWAEKLFSQLFASKG